jgi:hypothetical protein
MQTCPPPEPTDSKQLPVPLMLCIEGDDMPQMTTMKLADIKIEAQVRKTFDQQELRRLGRTSSSTGCSNRCWCGRTAYSLPASDAAGPCC